MKETIRGFKAIIDGEMDDYPEAAFFNVGTIEESWNVQKKWVQNKEINYGKYI